MSEGEINAEMLAIKRGIDKLQDSINKSQLKPVARDSGIPENRRTTMDEAENRMGQNARPKSVRSTALPNVHAEPDDLIESIRTNVKEPYRFALTSTPYHANTSGYNFLLMNETNITTRRTGNITRSDKRKTDILKPDNLTVVHPGWISSPILNFVPN